MAKRSALYNLYADRLALCSSPDELLKISCDIKSKSFRADERAALVLACVFIAKKFDKDGMNVHEVS